MSRESALAQVPQADIPPSVPFTETPNGTKAPDNEMETPSTPSTPEPELKSTPFSRLAQQEAELVRRKQEFARERDQVNSEREKLLQVKKTYDEYLQAKQKDPIQALKMLGFTETDIINYLADQAPVEETPEQKAAKAGEAAAEAKIKAFEETQRKKGLEEQERADRALVDTYMSSVGQTLTANKDKFEYCNYFGDQAKEQIYETVKAVIALEGEAITPMEAAEMVEAYYEETDKEMSTTIKKRQPKEPTPAPETPDVITRTRTVTPGFPNEPQPNPVIQKSRTLHQAATSTMASARLNRNETKEQKRERLIEALRSGAKL
jgi:hypothetical protein